MWHGYDRQMSVAFGNRIGFRAGQRHALTQAKRAFVMRQPNAHSDDLLPRYL